MSRHRFHTICPICSGGEKFFWVHADDEGDDYIWDNCDLECGKCKYRSFILNHKFKCGRDNHCTYQSIDKFAVIAAFSLISNISGINDPTKRNMINILKMHESD